MLFCGRSQYLDDPTGESSTLKSYRSREMHQRVLFAWSAFSFIPLFSRGSKLHLQTSQWYFPGRLAPNGFRSRHFINSLTDKPQFSKERVRDRAICHLPRNEARILHEKIQWLVPRVVVKSTARWKFSFYIRFPTLKEVLRNVVIVLLIKYTRCSLHVRTDPGELNASGC